MDQCDNDKLVESVVAGAAVTVGGGAGMCSLVSTFGIASTGAAISSLNGAAAVSATLAWFGGGDACGVLA